MLSSPIYHQISHDNDLEGLRHTFTMAQFLSSTLKGNTKQVPQMSASQIKWTFILSNITFGVTTDDFSPLACLVK